MIFIFIYINMITNFNDFSGMFGVEIDNILVSYYLKIDENKPINIDIYTKNGLYDNLSISIPESTNLEYNEFFINPKINKIIINTLISENFIEKTNKTAIAGDLKTYSYVLLI